LAFVELLEEQRVLDKTIEPVQNILNRNLHQSRWARMEAGFVDER
jgi:hypothetical protein